MKEVQKAVVIEPLVKEETKTTKLANEKKGKAEKTEPEVEKEQPKGPPKTIIREYFESLVVTVIMALFGITFIIQAVKVPTGSMQNTINIGDHLLVNKFVFAPGKSFPLLPQREIRRGDIIVFKYPGNKHDPAGDIQPNNIPFKTNYVKRVIGLPGDKIEIRGLQVYVNNQPLPEQWVAGINEDEKAPLKVEQPLPPKKPGESYTVYYYPKTIEAAQSGIPRHQESLHYAVDGPVTVPEDSYFVMGDNRDNSTDGRAWGFVPRDLVIGRAMFVYWSYDESAPSGSNFVFDFFTNSRWKRTGTLVK
jgi:signal peptidase I